VPWPIATTLVRFQLDDVVLEEYRVPDGEPKSTITAVPAPGTRGIFALTWESGHPAGEPLTHVAAFSSDDGATWEAVGLPTTENALELDLDALAGGARCRFCVKTSDGVHTTETVSDPFDLPLKPCLAIILAPEVGARVAAGTTIRLEGQGYWREERRPEFESLYWSSSQAGALGRGAIVEVRGLEAGRHEITLMAGDGDRAGRALIEVVVGES
jgi:hypothetical protein